MFHWRIAAAISLLAAACTQEDCPYAADESSLLALRPPRAALAKAAAAAAHASNVFLKCRTARGILWSLDGRRGHAPSLYGWAPINVPNGSRLQLRLCHVGNRAIRGTEALRGPLPALIGNVGQGATVQVLVLRSFNVWLQGNLSLGQGATLLPRVLHGAVLPEAKIEVALSASANVRVAVAGSRVDVSEEGGLLAPVIQGEEMVGQQLWLHVRSCGNVHSQEAEGELQASNGSLVAPLLTARELRAASVQVRVERSGLVRLRALSIRDTGALLLPMVQLHSSENSTLELEMEAAGRFAGQDMVLEHGNLVSGLLRLDRATSPEGTEIRGMRGSKASLSVRHSANVVRAKHVDLSHGALLAVAFAGDSGFERGSEMRVSMQHVASIEHAQRATLVNAHLVVAVCDLVFAVLDAMLDIGLREVGSMSGGSLQLREGARLAGTVFGNIRAHQTCRFNKANVSAGVVQSFKVKVAGDLTLQNSWLMGSVVAALFDRSKVSLELRDALNAAVGGNLEMASGGFLGSVQGDLLDRTTYHLQLRRALSASVRGDFTMAPGAKLLGAVQQGELFKARCHIHMVKVANVEVEGNVLLSSGSTLLEDVLAGDVLFGSASLSVKEACNVKAGGQAQLHNASWLLGHLVSGRFFSTSLQLQLRGTAQLEAWDAVLESSGLAQQLMTGYGSENVTASLLAARVANLRARSAHLNDSQLLQALSSQEIKNSTLDLAVQGAANMAAAGSMSLVAASLLGSLVDMKGLPTEQVLPGLVIAANASDVANARADSLDMEGSQGLSHGCRSEEVLLGAGLSLDLRRVGNAFVRHAAMRGSALLGPLFAMPRLNDSRLSASLQDTAGLETLPWSAQLQSSSLLASVLGDTNATVPELRIVRTALACWHLGSATEEEHGTWAEAREKGVLCADGAAQLQAEAAEFLQSCEGPRLCRLRE